MNACNHLTMFETNATLSVLFAEGFWWFFFIFFSNLIILRTAVISQRDCAHTRQTKASCPLHDQRKGNWCFGALTLGVGVVRINVRGFFLFFGFTVAWLASVCQIPSLPFPFSAFIFRLFRGPRSFSHVLFSSQISMLLFLVLLGQVFGGNLWALVDGKFNLYTSPGGVGDAWAGPVRDLITGFPPLPNVSGAVYAPGLSKWLLFQSTGQTYAVSSNLVVFTNFSLPLIDTVLPKVYAFRTSSPQSADVFPQAAAWGNGTMMLVSGHFCFFVVNEALTFNAAPKVGVGPFSFVATSSDLVGWNVNSSLSMLLDPTCVAFDGNSTWLVGQSSGTVLRSTDGTTWSSAISVNGPSVKALAFGGGTWVACGVSNLAISFSQNGGMSWILSTSARNVFNACNSVAYGLGALGVPVFVAAGLGINRFNALAYSVDGNIWVSIPNWFSTEGFAVAFGFSQFKAASQSDGAPGNLEYSSDGILFKNGTIPDPEATNFVMIASNDDVLSFSTTGTTTSAGTLLTTTTASPSTTDSTTLLATTATSTSTAIATFSVPTSAPVNSCSLNGLSSCSCTGSVCTSSVPVTASSVLVVSSSSSLSILGTLTLLPGSTLVASITSLTVSAPALASASLTASVAGVLQLSVGAVQSGVVTVLSAGLITGTFSSVVATSTLPCTVVTATPSYSETAITVAFSTSNSCDGLSPGAIAGIAVAAAVVGLLLIGLAICLMRRALSRRDERANKELRANHMANIHY